MDSVITAAKVQEQDPFALTLAQIDNQISKNEEQDKSQSYLGQAFDFIWRADERSLAKLKEMRTSVEQLQQNNDRDALAKMQQEIRDQIKKDNKEIKLQENINFYGGTTVKVGAIFVGGPIGWAATGALYALDSANPYDSVGTQVVDASLGTAEGLLLKGAFGAVSALKMPFYAKGMGMGVTSRFLSSSLDRYNYLNPKTNAYEVSHGLKQTMKATFNPTALLTDAAVFTVGFGVGYGVNKMASPLLAQSRIATRLSTAASWGTSSGAVREAVRQVSKNETINVGKIVGHGLLGGALFTVAAIPGTLQAEYEYHKMMQHHTDAHGNQIIPDSKLGSYKKSGTVKAEKLSHDLDWTSAGGDKLHGAAGDYKVTGPDGSTWTVKADIFEQTYSQVSGSPGVFAKTAVARAMILDKPTTVQTLEGPSNGNPGDYLVVGPKGEQYIVPKATFESSYKPVDKVSD